MPKHKESEQKRIFKAIEAISGHANLLTIPRVFVDFTGALDTALFLSQSIYWSDKGDQDGWFFKSYSDWQKEITLSEYQIRKAATTLKEMGILETKIRKAYGSPTVHYRINKEIFSDSFLKFLKERNLKNSRNIYTEITTLDSEKVLNIKRKGGNGKPRESINDLRKDQYRRSDDIDNYLANQQSNSYIKK